MKKSCVRKKHKEYKPFLLPSRFVVRAYFSIGEAEALLPSLGALVERAQLLKQRLERYERVVVKRRVMADGTAELSDFSIGETYDTQLQSLKEAFYAVVERIESLGCVLRDVEQGIVDFYARFEGRDVFLCWRLGERKIRFWHEAEDGAAGRKRIIELK
jgi:hypothetical protein